jgi:hypothetical protein
MTPAFASSTGLSSKSSCRKRRSRLRRAIPGARTPAQALVLVIAFGPVDKRDPSAGTGYPHTPKSVSAVFGGEQK